MSWPTWGDKGVTIKDLQATITELTAISDRKSEAVAQHWATIVELTDKLKQIAADEEYYKNHVNYLDYLDEQEKTDE